MRIYKDPVIVDVIASSNEDNQWWQVLLPGYGRAWVHPKSIERHVEHDQLPAAHQISMLRNSSSDSTIDDLFGVVAIIGSSMTSVVIENCNDRTDRLLEPEDINGIMAACPRLQTLHLSHINASPACFRALAHSASDGESRLQSIEISLCSDGDPRCLIDFFTILCDESHPLTVHLKELCISVRPYRREDMCFLETLAVMLARNQSLVKFTLVVDDCCRRGDQEAWVAARLFPGQDGTHIYTIDASIRRKSRLAFLSVLASTRNHPESAMTRLDSAVLASIFDFAAHRFTRTVHLIYFDK